LAAGSERIVGAPTGSNVTSGFGGITLPIGLELAWADSLHHNFSIFVPIVDLGAVASYRFSNSTASTS
jgi:hypothetical protein